jgi:hypothetical protein
MNDVTPVKPRSSSTSDLPKKIVSSERALALPAVFDSNKYVALSVFPLETLRLNGVCTTDHINAMFDTAHELSEDVALLQSDNASLKSQINKLREKLVNLWDHCPPESVYRQTRKLLTHLKRPHVGIQPGAMAQLQFPDLRIRLHFGKNLLIEQLLWTLHQLFLRLRFLPSKNTLVVSKLSPTERRQHWSSCGTVKHRLQPLIGPRNSASVPVI